MRPRAAVGPLLVAAAALGCAQPGTPPGGEVDQLPPRVVEVVPAAFDTLRDLGAWVVIRFDERISEQLQGVRNWEEAVLVSPMTSPVRVDAGRRSVRISLVRDWEPNRVYRVVVRPVFRDLFRNQRGEPVDLVFSTGAPIPESAMAGFATDRLTGGPTAEARVEAVREADQTRFVAVTDTSGFFAFPFMGSGTYRLRAWVDQNRSLEPDFTEIQDSARVVLAGVDTAIVELALLRPDTTAPRLARAEALDTVRIRLHFDDYFAPGAIDGEAVLFSLPDSTRIGQGELFHATRLDSLLAPDEDAAALRRETRAVLDSLRRADPQADTAAPATVEQEQEAEEIARRRLSDGPRQRTGPQRPQAPRPAQQLILLAPGPLTPGSEYLVRVSGLANIQGIRGGGEASFTVPLAPPPPDEPPADTVTADTVTADPTTASPTAANPTTAGRGPG